MIVLNATEEQYNSLNGVGSKGWNISFSKDNSNNWVTSINCKIDNKYPKEAKDLLNQLEEIEHEPKIEMNEII